MTQSNRSIYVYGAGAHGLVVAEAAEAAGHHVRGFLDHLPQADTHGRWPIVNHSSVEVASAAIIVAIGDNLARRRIASDLHSAGWHVINVIHPTAWVSPSCAMGHGVYVGPHAVVNAGCKLGDGVIVNSGAVVEHDCVVGPYVHLAPRCVLGPNCRVGSLTMLGVGSAVAAELHIGEGCIVGAGAGVEQSVPDHHTAVGVPATLKRQ